jgi:polar amino acid transport system substrate-binding protein
MQTKNNYFLLVVLITLSFMMSACGSAGAPAAAESQPTDSIPVTIYSDDSYPPYSYQENGKAKGIYVDIMNTAFSRLNGYTVTIEPVPWKRGLGYLEAGIGFGIFPPYYRPDTRPWMDYSVPILDESLALFCNADVMQTPRANWPKDYADLKIGNNLGFSTFKPAELTPYNITIENAAGTDTNLLKLAKKQVDCYGNDKISILWELRRLKTEGKYTPSSGGQVEIMEAATLSSEKAYFGYTNTDKGAFTYKADFVAQLDKILTDMQASGEIEQIVDQFINQK